MKLVAQYDFYLKRYGLDGGLKHLHDMGYEYITYTFGRYDQPFATEWNDEQLRMQYYPVKEALENYNIKIEFAFLGSGIYNDLLPESSEDRKKMCLQTIRAASYLGCKKVVVQPAMINIKNSDSWENSKRISYEIFGELKKECERKDIQLVFMNNTISQAFLLGNYCFGSKASELKELATDFDAGILLDPVNAYHAQIRTEDLLMELKELVQGIMVRDIEYATRLSVIPTLGCLDYAGIARNLRFASKDVDLVVVDAPLYVQYSKYADSEEFVNQLGSLLQKFACVLREKACTDEEAKP